MLYIHCVRNKLNWILWCVLVVTFLRSLVYKKEHHTDWLPAKKTREKKKRLHYGSNKIRYGNKPCLTVVVIQYGSKKSTNVRTYQNDSVVNLTVIIWQICRKLKVWKFRHRLFSQWRHSPGPENAQKHSKLLPYFSFKSCLLYFLRTHRHHGFHWQKKVHWK